MQRTSQWMRGALCTLSLAVATTLSPATRGEDIDLFTSGGAADAGLRPNILIVIDNSANWSRADQAWPGGIKQGQAELRALRTVLNSVSDNVNIGLMLFTPGSGTNKDGTYVRYHVRQMTATNKAALQELLGSEACVDGNNSLNGTPNCLFKNYDNPAEKVGTAKTDYSAGLFEVFKYFGGYTNPANATTGVAGSPVSASQYGALRYSGDPDSKSDSAAYSGGASKPSYVSPITGANACAKNYVIFIGNGFPTQDSPASLLTGVGGDATQVAMPTFTSVASTLNTRLGTDTVCESNAACVTRATAAYPGYNSYSCSGGATKPAATFGTYSSCTAVNGSDCVTAAAAAGAASNVAGYTTYSCSGGSLKPTSSLGNYTSCTSLNSATCQTAAQTANGTGHVAGYTTYSCSGGSTKPTSSLGSYASCSTLNSSACQSAAQTANGTGDVPGFTSYSCSGGTTKADTSLGSLATCTNDAGCLTAAQTANGTNHVAGSTTYSCTGGTTKASNTNLGTYNTYELSTAQPSTACRTAAQTANGTNHEAGFSTYTCSGGSTPPSQSVTLNGCAVYNTTSACNTAGAANITPPANAGGATPTYTCTAVGSSCGGGGRNNSWTITASYPTYRTGQTMSVSYSCKTGYNMSASYSCLVNQSMSASYSCLINQAMSASYSCTQNQTMGATYSCLENQTMIGQTPITIVTPTGNTATPASNKVRHPDEWAKFLYTTDVSSVGGQQNIATYTIDVFNAKQDTDQTALLMSMAKQGGGRYFAATNEDAIVKALQEIIIEIQSVNSVFASASLPINATNRSQNENQVFIGMFRPDPDAKPKWYGNLKRFQIAVTNGVAGLADKDGSTAVSASTGFVQACAASYYTVDSGSYWSFSPNSAGTCTTYSGSSGPFSDLPDGSSVEKGAVAEVLRRGNDPRGTATTAVNRTMYTCTSTSSCSSLVTFDSSNVSQSAVGASSSAEHTNIISFSRGEDVLDENANGVTSETRASIHGDVAHSRPLPVNYGGSTGVVVFYGGNDGSFRAVSGTDGKEHWAFIAPEHHAKLKRLYDNTPYISYPGLPSTVSKGPKDYFFDGSAGVFQNADNSKVWIYPTMRRGGRMVYAFDVTSPTAPSIKWRFGCPNTADDTGCSTGSSQIGQTWSVPNVAAIKGYNSGTKPVVIMGGGYDSCEDQDTSNPSCGSTKGNRVYVLDADTGAVVATFSTDGAVPADITLVDRDADANADHAYVVDTRGNLYRIDFVDPSSLAALPAADWTITKIAAIASTAKRKFLFAPAALSLGTKIYLAFGSGDRERPLKSNYPYVENIQNRFYTFIDTFSNTTVNLDSTDLEDFTSGATCSTTVGSTKRGWFIDLNSGRGEQTVTSATIFGGLVFFSTNRPIDNLVNACGSNLGEARGYALNILNSSGTVGTPTTCGGSRSNTFVGGGLPPSPVVGRVPVTIAGQTKIISVVIGTVDRAGGASSPIGAQEVKPAIDSTRKRLYWYKKSDR